MTGTWARRMRFSSCGLGGDLFHAGGGLMVLLVITALNMYKPQGMTPYGWRKQQEERARLSRRPSAVSQESK